uniref:Uncharacterized protein n=1 Tax=Physcomitrium patens TaxID=3218 RepID=A0A2K1K0C5_PHYPA|nr:hypothetical protein PHYPA_014351 [Physcomitrium patens]
MLVLMLASDCSHCTLQQFTVGENSAFNPRSDRPTQIMTLSGLVFLLSCLRWNTQGVRFRPLFVFYGLDEPGCERSNWLTMIKS